MIAQSLNHELGPKGVHVVHVNVDGPVDAPETIGKLMPEVPYVSFEYYRSPSDVITC